MISHFYNEELLLPYWLEHHTKIFDHGIMIDYDSTDSSVEIIREMAPDWEIIVTNNRNALGKSVFDAIQCDLEVMHNEARLGNVWKVALNVTEFILSPNLKLFCNEFLNTNPSKLGFRMSGCEMVENPETKGTLTDSPLIKQKVFGYFNKGGSRNRLVHHAQNGRYLAGRHESLLDWEGFTVRQDDIYCLWYGFSPYPEVKDRKLQIQNRVPPSDVERNFGLEHFITENGLDNRYEALANNSYDLRTDAHFNLVWKATCNSLYGGTDV